MNGAIIIPINFIKGEIILKKCAWITIFTNKDGKYVVPHVPKNNISICKTLCTGLSRVIRDDVIPIKREEEGTEKIVIFFDHENKRFEVEATVDEVNVIYVLSELVKKLMQKDVNNVEITFIIEDNDVFVLNHYGIDIESICVIISNAIQQTTLHHFNVKTGQNQEVTINIKTNNYGEPFIISTEKQKKTILILINVLYEHIKML